MENKRGTFSIEKASIGLRVRQRGSIIQMAYLQGDDTEWYPIALTDDERVSLAMTLLNRKPTIVRVES